MSALPPVRAVYTREEWLAAHQQVELLAGKTPTRTSLLLASWAKFNIREKRVETNRLVEALATLPGGAVAEARLRPSDESHQLKPPEPAGVASRFELDNELLEQVEDLERTLQWIRAGKVPNRAEQRRSLETAIAKTRGALNIFVYENKLDTRWMATLSKSVTEKLRSRHYFRRDRYSKD